MSLCLLLKQQQHIRGITVSVLPCFSFFSAVNIKQIHPPTFCSIQHTTDFFERDLTYVAVHPGGTPSTHIVTSMRGTLKENLRTTRHEWRVLPDFDRWLLFDDQEGHSTKDQDLHLALLVSLRSNIDCS